MNDEKKEFRLGEEFFLHFRRATLVRTLPLILLAGAGGLVVARGDSDMPPGIAVAVICFLLLTAWRHYRQQAERFRGFRVLLSASGLQRNQPGLTEVFIPASQISRVAALPGKSLTVYGPTPQQVIVIPATTEGYQQIREVVDAWCPPEVSAQARLSSQLPAIAGVATIVALVTVFRSENAVIVMPVGLALIVFLGWAISSVRRSPHLDAGLKRSLWLVLVPIAAIAARIWSVWGIWPAG